MPENESQNEKIAKMTFSSIFSHYVSKIEKRGRDKAQLHEVITWLTGYSEVEIDALAKTPTTFSQFFDQARIHPKS